MKEIIAIIRPGKWAETLAKLEEIGAGGITRQRIYGRGKQRGLRYTTDLEDPRGISFLPKWMVIMVVEDLKVDAVVEVILNTNRTGEIGDGKVFICPMANSIRVRTGESEAHALN
jgi:nitrogen regulatory protein PII 2